MSKPKNDIYLKGRCVTKAVNPEHGMFPNPQYFKLHPRIFTKEGYLVTHAAFIDRNIWLPNKLNQQEQWMYWHWVRDNYKPLDKIDGTHHPYIQRECVNVNIKHLKEKIKNDSAL